MHKTTVRLNVTNVPIFKPNNAAGFEYETFRYDTVPDAQAGLVILSEYLVELNKQKDKDKKLRIGHYEIRELRDGRYVTVEEGSV